MDQNLQANNLSGSLFSGSEVQSSSEAAAPSIVDPEPSNAAGAPAWYIERVQADIAEFRKTPLFKAMKDAIYLYHEVPIVLIRGIYAGGGYPAGPYLGCIPTGRGTRGSLLNPKALDLLPPDIKAILAEKLALEHIRLCSLGEWIFTLDIKDFRIVR